MQDPAVDDDAAADAGADRQVDERVDVLGRTPQVLAEGGAVDVGVEPDRDAERGPERPHDVGVGPAGLGGLGDPPVGGGVRVRVAGPEGPVPDGGDLLAVLGLPGREVVDDLRQALVRGAGGEPDLVAQVVGSRSHRADHLGPAGLDGSDQWLHVPVPSCGGLLHPSNPGAGLEACPRGHGIRSTVPPWGRVVHPRLGKGRGCTGLAARTGVRAWWPLRPGRRAPWPWAGPRPRSPPRSSPPRPPWRSRGPW